MNQQSIKVLAIPVNPGKSSIKILSINQAKDIPTNGYKEFDIQLRSQSGTNNTVIVQSIEDISKVININNITVLSLRNCGLQDLPTEIAQLSLTELDVMQNNLIHVPECLYTGLQNLEVLNLGFNPVLDFYLIPKCGENLKKLNLEGCNFANVPKWILEMKAIQLEQLNYSHNEQSDLIRKDWPQLPMKLKKLVFNNTHIRQKMLHFFKHFTLLQYLDIGNDGTTNGTKHINVIMDINQFLKDVSWYNHIQVLKLNDLNLNELSEDICKMVNLKELHLKQNCLMGIPANMCALKDLVVLDVSYNCIYSLPNLCLQMLAELHAARNHLLTLNLESLPRLRYVDLYDNELDSLEMNMSSIQAIDLERNLQNPEVLLGITSIGNYTERRDNLRSQISQVDKQECRSVGVKVITMDLGSPFGGYGDAGFLQGAEDDFYSDRGSDELDDSQKLSDDGNCVEEDWGDWLESRPIDWVTLSDSEFLPDCETRSTTKVDCLENIDKGMDNLFIDAD